MCKHTAITRASSPADLGVVVITSHADQIARDHRY
jgi:hypothetical protein